MIRNSRTFDRALSLITLMAIVMASFPVFPRVAEAADTIFEDGFEESPAFSNPAWTADPQWGTTGSNAHSGSKKAKVEGSATDPDVLETSVDTSGYEDLTLSFWYRFQGLEADDSVVVEWYDGTNWNNLESFSGETGTSTDDITTWTEWTETLPAGAEDNSVFALRFTSDMNAGDDKFYLDDVLIEGEEVVVSTTTPVEEYFNGFESDTVDWTDNGGTTTRVDDGTGDIPSQCGDYFAVIDGPVFTRWGGYADEFPTGGFTTEIDVYLDASLSDGSPDKGFDFSSAINGVDGNHRRDFIFHLETDSTQPGVWLVNASNNAPGNPSVDVDSAEITETGWYTLQAYFHDNGSGELEVTMNVIKRSDDSVVFTEDRSDPSDVIGTTVGGNRYGWFTGHRFDFEELAIDNAALYLGGPEDRVCASDVPDTQTSETIVVSGDTTTSANQPEVGWMFNRDTTTQSPFEFNTDMPGIGIGSLFVEPITNTINGNNDKFIGELYLYEEVSDIESISYDFKLASGSESKEEHFYANAYVTLPTPNSWYDCRYDIVPTSGSTGSFTTVTFDPESTYDVTSKVPGSYVCPASPSDMPEGSTLNFFALNVGDTSVNDQDVSGYLDEVVTVIDEGSNTHTTTYDFEPEQTATVEICKFNEDQEPLADWTLMLRGDHVETVNVPSTGIEVFSTDNLDGDYAFIANGTYIYRPGYTGSTTDAAYSMRTDGNDPIDPTGHPYDPWVRVNDFDSPWEGYLGITVDGALGTTDWGSIFNPLHEYALQYNGDGDPAGFKMVDSAYGDNSGSLTVDINEGYVGVTGRDGCVTFEDVPYGTYEIDEIMQDGWSNVSGLGEVVVDGEEEVFIVVNSDEPQQCVDDLDGDWADAVVSFEQGDRKNGTDVLEARSDEEDALGESDWVSGGSTGFVSLGFGGSIVVSFETFVPNVEGNDISIHEATNGTYPAETALIEVSQTGEDDDWYEVGTSTNTGVSYFDFDSTGLAWIKYVRVTDTTNPAIHTNDADGFDLDAVDATQTVCAEPEEPQMCSVTVISDETNYVEEMEDNAVLAWVHPTGWTAVIDLANWIWGTYQVVNPTVDTTQTFVKEFEWSGGIASATLDIATDNSYVVTLNGVEVASSTDENNFQIGTQDSYNISSYVEVGVNTLEIEVLNKGVPGSTPTGNPAGLKYNLTVVSDETGEDCMFAPEADLEITRPETEDQVLSGEYTFEAEYIDADDNADPVLWAIRAGTCNSGSGTVAGNVDSFNTPYMWNGASFSSTIDMDEWEEGEYCFVVNPTEDGGTNFRETRWFTLEHPEPTQCLIVSDTSTLVVENNDFAVETWDENNNWTHDIADATWIWDSFYVEDPEATTTRTFKETFTVTEVGAAELDIAADNTYTVYINGDLIVEHLNSNNYQTPDEYDVTSFIDEGENELEIIVTNIGTDGSIAKSNPAGLLFRLEIETDGGQCLSTTEPDEGEPEPTPTYEVFGFAWNDDNTNDVKDGEEGYLAGVAVEITNGTTTVATTTDAGGRYYFMVAPDTWTLSAALSDWDPTYPDTTNNDHVVIVTATTTGPHDFGFEADEDGGGGGGGGGGNSRAGNDDDTPAPLVAGTSTTVLDGMGGGIDLWEDLRNEIGNSGGPFGSVLGATAEAQELDATTTIEVGDDEATPAEDGEENASAPWKNWLCDYLWLLPLLWIIVSALAYWRKESYEDPRAMFWTQIIFGAVTFILLVTYFIWEVPCAWVPSAIVAIGSAVMSYYGKE